MGISNLFKTKSEVSQTVNTPVPQAHGATSQHERPEGLNYQQWGSQCAGQTKASSASLTPALNIVVLANKTEQQRDEARQAASKADINAQIDQKNTLINSENQRIEQYQQAIDAFNDSIAEKQAEINNIRQGNANQRPLAKVHFWIGAVICVLLAIYLFVFYSSASYSAFFRDASSLDVGDAIFYPKAFGDALATSFGQFLFILLMPVIFLGLGFLVHQYARKDGKVKYFKTGVLYIITFIFDALLAYEISAQMYSPSGPDAPATLKMSMAFNEPSFWIIIFSGFIAYVIWGLVFDSTIDAYGEMKMGSTTIKRLQQEIDAEKAKIAQKQNDINNCNNKVTGLQTEIQKLQSDLSKTFVYDLNVIKRELNNFFNGWIGYMTLMGMSADDQNDAKAQLNSVLSTLNNP